MTFCQYIISGFKDVKNLRKSYFFSEFLQLKIKTIYYVDKQYAEYDYDLFHLEFTCIVHFRAFKKMQCRDALRRCRHPVLTAQ